LTVKRTGDGIVLTSAYLKNKKIQCIRDGRWIQKAISLEGESGKTAEAYQYWRGNEAA
jgi:hypothetical protein